MPNTTIDHGVFIREWNNSFSTTILETDDLIILSDSDDSFHHLKTELEKMFDLTSKQAHS